MADKTVIDDLFDNRVDSVRRDVLRSAATGPTVIGSRRSAIALWAQSRRYLRNGDVTKDAPMAGTQCYRRFSRVRSASIRLAATVRATQALHGTAVSRETPGRARPSRTIQCETAWWNATKAVSPIDSKIVTTSGARIKTITVVVIGISNHARAPETVAHGATAGLPRSEAPSENEVDRQYDCHELFAASSIAGLIPPNAEASGTIIGKHVQRTDYDRSFGIEQSSRAGVRARPVERREPVEIAVRAAAENDLPTIGSDEYADDRGSDDAGDGFGRKLFLEPHDPGCNFPERGGVGNVTAKHSNQR